MKRILWLIPLAALLLLGAKTRVTLAPIQEWAALGNTMLVYSNGRVTNVNLDGLVLDTPVGGIPTLRVVASPGGSACPAPTTDVLDATMVLSRMPTSGCMFLLLRNGVLQRDVDDYTRTGQAITLVGKLSTDSVTAYYQ